MADAPKSESGGGIGFIEVAIGIFILLAILSGGLKGGNPESTTSTGATGALILSLGTDGTCQIVLDSPIGFQFVGLVSMKVAGKLIHCNTSDNQTAFFLQVLDANGVPVSDYTAIPIVQNNDTVLTFNTNFAFTTPSRTKKGTAVFTPNVQNISTSQALRVPVVFRK
jgi:hypothetical protein